MNIFKWFKRGGNTPPEVTAPETEPEPIGDFAKNVVKIYEMEPSIVTLGTSFGVGFTDTISDGNEISVIKNLSISLVSTNDERKSTYPKVDSIYSCNGVALNCSESEAVFTARTRLEKRIQESKRNEAIALIARIANQTTDNNPNAD